MSAFQIGWLLLVIFNICLSVWLFQRKRQLEKEYVDKHAELQRKFDRVMREQEQDLKSSVHAYNQVREEYRTILAELKSKQVPSVDGG